MKNIPVYEVRNRYELDELLSALHEQIRNNASIYRMYQASDQLRKYLPSVVTEIKNRAALYARMTAARKVV